MDVTNPFLHLHLILGEFAMYYHRSIHHLLDTEDGHFTVIDNTEVNIHRIDFFVYIVFFVKFIQFLSFEHLFTCKGHFFL